MDKVSFWPRKAMATLTPTKGSVLISIFDRRDGPLERVHPGWAEVLPLRFHDVSDPEMGGVEQFRVDQAKAIFDLLDRHPQCPEVVVHCQHGQSRSAAVALYLSAIFGAPCYQGPAPVQHPYSFANKLVLRVMADADPGA